MVAGRVQPPYLKIGFDTLNGIYRNKCLTIGPKEDIRIQLFAEFIQSKVQNIFSIILGNYKSELVLRIEIGNITYRQSKSLLPEEIRNRVRYFLFSTTGSFCVSDKLSNTSSIRLSRLKSRIYFSVRLSKRSIVCNKRS